MADISRRLAAVSDSRGRIVSIFVGAVLLPSIALSVLSFNAVPKQAENLKLSLLRQAEQLLYYVEEDLEQATRRRALEAARAVDPELLLEGRPEAVRRALAEAGMAQVSFDSLRLEAWSRSPGAPDPSDRGGAELRALRAALSGKTSKATPRDQDDEDAVPLTTASGEELGVVRFRFSCDYAHRQLVQEFFDTGFTNPGEAWVIRVSEPTGELLHENAATAKGERFEVERVMTAPSFEGVRLQLRYRDRSIEQEVRRLAIAKTALIGFIDVMLLAGLGLVWANVRRELKLSRLKSDFVANVSHELKTPLALIRLYAETLELARVPTEERKGEYYRVIGKESRRLTQLINNILDFSRIEAGRKEYRLVPSDIGAVVRDVVESYRFAIEKLGFALTLEVADDLPELALDPEALSQALINLLNNCDQVQPGAQGDHGQPAPRAQSRAVVGERPGHRDPARRAPPHLREVLPRRDQPGAHHQGQRARSGARPAHHRGPRGTRGAAQHARRGQHLHALAAGARAQPLGRARASPRYDGAPRGRRAAMSKILIVEDEPDMVAGLKDNFEFEGYEVVTASDGQSGLEQARSLKPDLLVLDVMLPRLSGLEVCKTLRSEGYEGPILMLTARGQEIDKVVGLELGADDYVTKPFSIRELLARVKAVLRRTDGKAKRLARYSFADIELDFEAYKATKDGEALELSPREFELLRYLIERKGDTVSRDQLLEDVWGYESYPSTRTVDTHIAKLRAKIGDSGSEPRYILTIHGMGYKFIDPS